MGALGGACKKPGVEGSQASVRRRPGNWARRRRRRRVCSGRRFQRRRAHQGHKAHREGGLLHQFALHPAITHQGLGPAGGSQGDHQATALFELRRQGRGHPGRRRGDQDGVKGGCLRPALVAVAAPDLHPAIAQVFEARPRPAGPTPGGFRC